MNNSDDDKQFEVLRKLHKNSKLTQRKLADELGYSLGKLNFILNELKKKGNGKIQKF